jgi:hypothetical protein
MPMANSSTFILNRLATHMCPNSWAATSSVNIPTK